MSLEELLTVIGAGLGIVGTLLYIIREISMYIRAYRKKEANEILIETQEEIKVLEEILTKPQKLFPCRT
jgi:hypothetical protein